MLNRALSKAKKEGGKKIPINFQVPIELKSDFEDLCKKNSVSITSMLIGLMETAIEEAQGVFYDINIESMLAINNRINELNKILDNFYEDDSSSGDRRFKDELLDIEIARHQYNEANYELSRLKKLFEIYGDKE